MVDNLINNFAAWFCQTDTQTPSTWITRSTWRDVDRFCLRSSSRTRPSARFVTCISKAEVSHCSLKPDSKAQHVTSSRGYIHWSDSVLTPVMWLGQLRPWLVTVTLNLRVEKLKNVNARRVSVIMGGRVTIIEFLWENLKRCKNLRKSFTPLQVNF